VTEQDFLVILAEHWPALLADLAPEDARRFTELVRQLRSAQTAGEATEAGHRLRQFTKKLPLRHPVRAAASRERYAAERAAPDLANIAAILGVLDLSWPADDGDEADDDPEAWLLAAPSLSEQEVMALGVAPRQPGLIRLPGRDEQGQPRLPAFQFGPDGQPVPVVLAVNELLGAGTDPWGAADWWLGENAWLDAIPADLIDRAADAVLLKAARAVGWEE